MTDKFMVFDVESIGLHGDGFAVAWVVVNRNGERLGEGCLACDPAQCGGTHEGRLWVAEHVPALEATSPTPQHMRNGFWHECSALSAGVTGQRITDSSRGPYSGPFFAT